MRRRAEVRYEVCVCMGHANGWQIDRAHMCVFKYFAWQQALLLQERYQSTVGERRVRVCVAVSACVYVSVRWRVTNNLRHWDKCQLFLKIVIAEAASEETKTTLTLLLQTLTHTQLYACVCVPERALQEKACETRMAWRTSKAIRKQDPGDTSTANWERDVAVHEQHIQSRQTYMVYTHVYICTK